MAEEFYTPKETVELPKEYQGQYVAETKDHRDEFEEEPENKAEKKPLGLMAKMKKMAYLVAASASVVTIGAAAIESEPVVSEPSSSVVVWEAPRDVADKSFPVLSNLEPNGYVEGYGVINEDFIYLQKIDDSVTTETLTLWNSLNRDGIDTSGTFSEEQIHYDSNTNTLYLNDFMAEDYLINANMMGNGFKINVSGSCKLWGIEVWGFHYGGSLTITGDGYLEIVSSGVSPGIVMYAEESNTCLMIDSEVTLWIDSGDYAIIIWNTLMEKSIYYLQPSTLSGGVRRYMDSGDGTYIGMIAEWDPDNNGYNKSRSVLFTY